MDDAFAAEITGETVKTMAELKEEIKEELGQAKGKGGRSSFENEFLKGARHFVKSGLARSID